MRACACAGVWVIDLYRNTICLEMDSPMANHNGSTHKLLQLIWEARIVYLSLLQFIHFFSTRKLQM